MKPPNHYAGYGLDRMAERRCDSDWLRGQLESERTRIVAVWRSRLLVEEGEAPRAVHFRACDLGPLMSANGEAVFLGQRDETAHFALDVSHLDDPLAHPSFGGRGAFVDLRTVGFLLPREDSGLLAYAKGIVHWHERHRFCGVCGSPTEMRDGGHLRVCTDPACGASHFPRTDPAVIMLVSRGDRIVLGRKREWPEGMYSTLAGFVEPGESLEEAVAREVREEVGIEIDNIRYHSSQPWPFPASLMLGFDAEALSEAIRMNADELEDARWFTRAELADGAAGIARRPRSDSIARRLIEDWMRDG